MNKRTDIQTNHYYIQDRVIILLKPAVVFLLTAGIIGGGFHQWAGINDETTVFYFSTTVAAHATAVLSIY